MPTHPPLQTASIGSNIQLAFIDSWHDRTDFPPAYTTVVGLHGVGFNSGKPRTAPLDARVPAIAGG